MKKVYEDIFILARQVNGVNVQYSRDHVTDIEEARIYAANLNKLESDGEWKVLKYGRPFPVK